MEQASPLPYSRGWPREHTPLWRAGKGHVAKATRHAPPKAPKDRGPGRVCAAEDCGTLLNRYNPGPTCMAHDTEAA